MENMIVLCQVVEEKDSIKQSHILKYKYGMNPLTVTWSPILHTEYGYKKF